MVTVPWGKMDPLGPAEAVIADVLRAKLAVMAVLVFTVKEQVGEVPVHPPDHPEKVELAFGAAVRATTVPALKVIPVGLLVMVPVPVPILVMLNVYWDAPAWVMVNVFPATVRVPVRDEELALAETE
jgi:hypothetical protein